MTHTPQHSHTRDARPSTRPTNVDDTLRCYCGSLMIYRANGKYGPFYSCRRWPECDGAIGTHPDGRPLGTVVDQDTRRARVTAHDLFDRLWQNAPAKRRKRKRSRWYKVLREHLGMTREQCHIANFDRAQCEAVVAFARHYLTHRKARHEIELQHDLQHTLNHPTHTET